MLKKGQGISLNVIVIAAIALLVLVILSIIFLGRMGQTGQQLNDCENKGGKCAYPGESCGDPGSSVQNFPTAYPLWKCMGADGKVDPTIKCCVQPE
ncbi:hypothetical protein JW968_05360 [Candidatus Woesearchaeota archaeon]|nr:hypothetical protein [Candidatus Woesearchaeota archaeon]